ncbi:hypothetical protein [Nocardia sp. NBC_00403]|uniref:hypothetical protein n=1 Tax=Nocardia sp. NBC_00403 TaxID=2975990 RepID=UPI002E1A0B54
MTILLHDGRRPGHLGWLKETVTAGLAGGAILNPFCTPPVSVPRHPSAQNVIADLRGGSIFEEIGPEILFDSATWAATLPSTDQWEVYDQWPLWPHHTRGDLRDADAIADHVRGVFAIQSDLDVPFLAPTVAVDSPTGQTAATALELAAESIRQQRGCILTICGVNSFWRAGPALDAFMGKVARLRPKAYYVIPLRDRSGYPADLTDADAIAGWLRSIHSLALRSRVVAGYTDYLGIIAAAAGADTVGTGWDQGQRVCNPDSFRGTEPGGKNVNYSPHPALLARFTETTARGLHDLAPKFAETMRWGEPIPADMREHREQHLSALRKQVASVLKSGPLHTDRFAEVHRMFVGADLSWNHAIALRSKDVGRREKAMWLEGMRSGFEAYVRAER